MKETYLEMPTVRKRWLNVTVRGLSPFLSHRFSPQAQREMEDTKEGKAKGTRKKKDPQALYLQSLYPVDGEDGQYGIPAAHFKGAIINACRHKDDRAMTQMAGVVFVEGDILPIRGSAPKMRADIVRIGHKTADTRYRGEFDEWEIDLTIRIIADTASPIEILELLQLGGEMVGVGDWRPQKRGEFGRFEIVGKPTLIET